MPSTAAITVPPAELGPGRTPMLGYFLQRLRFGRDPISHLVGLHERYGVLSAWDGPRYPAMVFAFAPQSNQALGKADEFDWAARRVLGPHPTDALATLSGNILRMNGDAYSRRRELIRPAFRHSLVDDWRAAMASATHAMLDSWQDRREVDLLAETHRLVVAISVRTIFHVDDPAMIHALDRAIDDLYRSATNVVARLPLNVTGIPYRRMSEAADRLLQVIKELMRLGRGSNAMIELLRTAKDANGGSLSEDELIGEATNLMNHDNLRSALTWTLFLLAQHPQVYRDLADEIRGVARGGDAGAVRHEELPLLDRVVKESLRLFPPFAFGRRYAIKKRALGPFTLGPGTTVIFSPYITHRLPDLYAEPSRFRPERWETLRPAACEYLPFGTGSHFCMGMRFATLELKTVVASVVQRHSLRVVHGARIDRAFRLVLQPAGPVPVLLGGRDEPLGTAEVSGNVREMVTLSSCAAHQLWECESCRS